MKHLKWVGLFVAAMLLTGIQGYAQEKAAPKATGASLYQRLGEAPGVRLLVDSLVFKMKSDKHCADLVKTNPDGFKKCMGQCITMVAGGPKINCTANAGCPGCKTPCPKGKATCAKCTCAGCALKAMHITGAQWDAMMADLGWAADHNAIGAWQKTQLLKGMAHVRPMLVGKTAAAKPAAKPVKKAAAAPKAKAPKH